jgi:chloride channel protein, CIC family
MPDTSRLLAWQRAVSARISERGQGILRRILALGIDESTLLIGFALAIGAAVGVTVILFYSLINLAQEVALSAADTLTVLGRLSIVLVVIAGMLAGRALIRYGARDSDGQNIPDVMRAVVKSGGVIRSGATAIKTVSAAVLIGTGGSVGAEGPVAVAGSALGSRIGRYFRSGPQRLRVLVACGAAAGISAAFNAPIAGVFFSLEKVMGTFAVTAFPPILVSSVIAAAISRAAFGNSPVIEIPTAYGLASSGEFVYYAGLGVITGLVGVLYSRAIYKASDLINGVRHWWLGVILAALPVALLNVVFRADLWGRGHETLDMSIIAQRPWYFLIALAMAKLVATSTTVSAARAGGVFTPAIFVGATLAGGLASAGRQLLGLNLNPEAFALVGMAGMIAGSTHAPLTAIMIVFEMTSDYDLILPLMLVGAVAYITAKRVYPESVYSEWLVRRGEHLSHGQDAALLERLHVRDSYDGNPQVLSENATVPQIMEAVSVSAQMEFPVIDADLRFRGMLNYHDLRQMHAEADSLGPLVVAGDLASEAVATVTPEDSMLTALRRLALRGSHHIPVVDAHDPGRLRGLISRGEIFAAYDRALLTENPAESQTMED